MEHTARGHAPCFCAPPAPTQQQQQQQQRDPVAAASVATAGSVALAYQAAFVLWRRTTGDVRPSGAGHGGTR